MEMIYYWWDHNVDDASSIYLTSRHTTALMDIKRPAMDLGLEWTSLVARPGLTDLTTP